MNCLECQRLIQRCLDGERVPADGGEFATHLIICSDCRDDYAAAQCLLDGLRVLPRLRPPSDLLERICRRIMVERKRASQLRRLVVGSGLAAGLLLTCWAVYTSSRFLSKDQTQGQSMRQAIVSLNERTGNGRIDQRKLLALINIPQGSFGTAGELEQVFEPPAESFREIQEAMSAGLEPVATSARQAVGLFLRDIPAIE